MKLDKIILQKLCAFCAYQERCSFDIEKKLTQLHVYGEHQLDYILHLQRENFLSDQRFAEHFAIGKFKNNQWGKRKIKQAMQQKQLPNSIIQNALNLITDKDYEKMGNNLLEKKNNTIKDPNLLKRKQKLANYLLQKGYENQLVFRWIELLFRNSN